MTNGQVLITLGREFGSGGHKVAQKIADALDIQYYDRNLLDKMFEGNKGMAQLMSRYDEQVAKPIISRRVRGYSNSMEENLAYMQFEYIRKMADEGQSFVLVGRCGEYVLREYPCHISLFVLGDMYDKIVRVMKRCGIEERDAISKIQRHDRLRKKYHNKFSDQKWGDSRSYDFCINSSRLGIEKTANLALDFIRARREML